MSAPTDFENDLRDVLAAAARSCPVPAVLEERVIAAAHRADPPMQWPRIVLRGLGQAFVSAGAVVLLFLVYEVYVTNYESRIAQAAVRKDLVTVWKSAPGDPLLALPGQGAPTPPNGAGIAIVYIPRLGSDYSWAVVEGTSDADIAKGPGHYTGTALPGQVGNFAIAGHRVGKGEPFLNLDQLRPGDPVIVQTDTRWFVYVVTGTEIVLPDDGAVIAPVPDEPGTTPTRRVMTMTTCHPKFTAAKRLAVHAELSRTVTADGTAMPAAIRAYYGQGQP